MYSWLKIFCFITFSQLAFITCNYIYSSLQAESKKMLSHLEVLSLEAKIIADGVKSNSTNTIEDLYQKLNDLEFRYIEDALGKASQMGITDQLRSCFSKMNFIVDYVEPALIADMCKNNYTLKHKDFIEVYRYAFGKHCMECVVIDYDDLNKCIASKGEECTKFYLKKLRHMEKLGFYSSEFKQYYLDGIEAEISLNEECANGFFEQPNFLTDGFIEEGKTADLCIKRKIQEIDDKKTEINLV